MLAQIKRHFGRKCLWYLGQLTTIPTLVIIIDLKVLMPFFIPSPNKEWGRGGKSPFLLNGQLSEWSFAICEDKCLKNMPWKTTVSSIFAPKTIFVNVKILILVDKLSISLDLQRYFWAKILIGDSSDNKCEKCFFCTLFLKVSFPLGAFLERLEKSRCNQKSESIKLPFKKNIQFNLVQRVNKIFGTKDQDLYL